MSLPIDNSIEPTDNPVNSKTAQKILGLSDTYISALKKAMGIKGRYFFVSEVRKWMRAHPEFRVRDIYPHWKKGHRSSRSNPE